MKDLQYKGNIQDYIIMMEDMNYQVCLSGIAWRKALHSGRNEDIKDRLSFAKVAPNDVTEFQLLLRQVRHTYKRRLLQKNKHHHNDHKLKDKKHKRKHDDDSDKGSDSKNPQMEKKGPKPVKADQGVALKSIPDSLLETRAQREECKHCSSKEHRWVFCKNPIKFSSNRKKNKKSKMETSVPEVVTTSSKIKTSSLVN
jgi:hypothetical protein